MYELQSLNYETHQICPKLAIYHITEQNIRSQSIRTKVKVKKKHMLIHTL